jgi:hypothetical protein
VTTLTECELLTIDIHQYHALLARLHEEDLAAKVGGPGREATPH